MNSTTKKNIAPAFLVGLIAALFALGLGSVIFIPIRTYLMSIIIQGIMGAIAFGVSAFVYCVCISKRKVNIGILILLSAACGFLKPVISNALFRGLLRAGLSTSLFTLIGLVIGFIVYSVGMVILLSICKGETQTEPHVTSTQPNHTYYQPQNTSGNSYAAPENLDALSENLLKAIKPSLKAPLTAVLCSKEEMRITNQNGEYHIEGYVNSQNSYGAMISTDFTATARYSNGTWVITGATVGVKNAKRYAKNFAVNYIVISIFVAVMGLLGYLLITLLVG